MCKLLLARDQWLELLETRYSQQMGKMAVWVSGGRSRMVFIE